MKAIAFLAVALASLSATTLAQQTELGGKVRSGQEVVVPAGETVQGDLITSAGTVRIDGRVDGDLAGSVLGATGSYTRAGSVGGSEQVTVQERREQAPTLAERALDRLRRYVSILVVGVLLLWLAPRAIGGAAEAVRGRPLASLGVGILGIIGGVALVVVVILVTVLVAVGLGLLGLGALAGATVFGGTLAAGVIAFLFFLAVAFGAEAAVGLALGRLLFRGDVRSFFRGLGAVAFGVLVVVLISAIPLVGGWLEALLVLLGLGGPVLMVLLGRRRLVEQPG